MDRTKDRFCSYATIDIVGPVPICIPIPIMRHIIRQKLSKTFFYFKSRNSAKKRLKQGIKDRKETIYSRTNYNLARE